MASMPAPSNPLCQSDPISLGLHSLQNSTAKEGPRSHNAPGEHIPAQTCAQPGGGRQGPNVMGNPFFPTLKAESWEWPFLGCLFLSFPGKALLHVFTSLHFPPLPGPSMLDYSRSFLLSATLDPPSFPRDFPHAAIANFFKDVLKPSTGCPLCQVPSLLSKGYPSPFIFQIFI